MSDITGKYDRLAERYSDLDYADSEAYYRRRAELVVRHGPPLRPGATVLDFACGDGGLGLSLLSFGFDYHGVDASARMVDVARRRLGDRVVKGTFEYQPSTPVDVTTIFRALYLVPDRSAFLQRVRSFTRVKLVFDFDPRAHSRELIETDLRLAGWSHVIVRPFFMPQRARLPHPLQRALYALEGVPGARVLTSLRFPLLVSASA
jgi:SAM-dependent methyltransferase